MLRNTSVTRSTSLREPYRATKLWLEAVAIFRKGVPLGKHRSYLKAYEGCFVAHDAVGWFHKQLQQHFDPGISRKQALQLLQKFYKSGIIVPVSSRASYAEDILDPVIRETDFKDNGSLYRLSGYTADNNDTMKKLKSKKSPVVNNLPPQHHISRERLPSRSPSQVKYNVIINPLSLEQIFIIWKDVFTHRFVQIVGCEAFQALANLEIRGENIRHNLTQTEKYGIVIISNPSENVPAWLDKAMKTLATWPRSRTNCDQSLCHVNYPGLENDILKLIKDYFRQYSNGAPLLTFELYDACITTFIRAELFDFNARLYSSKTTSASRTRLCHQLNLPVNTTTTTFQGRGGGTPQQHSVVREEMYPFNASESVENLIMDILTPSAVREAVRRGRGVSSRIQPKRILSTQIRRPTGILETSVSLNPMEDSILKSVPEPMSAKSFTAEKYKNPFFYETAFTGCDSPVTRVVSETELKSTFCTLPRRSSAAASVPVGPMSTPPRFVYENPTLELSASDMIYHPKYSKILDSSAIPGGARTPTNYSFYNYSNNSDSFDSPEANYHRTLPVRSHSSVELSDAVRDRAPYTPGGRNFFGRNPQGIAAEYANSPSRSARRTLDYYYGADACVPGLMTPEGKRMAIAAFRLLTLLLPASQRKHLQLLLRFMAKVSRNDKLMLDVAVSTRALIINTFFRTILNSADSAEFDELLALRIVTFMMDNDAEIFNIAEESDLVHQVEEILSEEQVTKIPVKEPTPPPVTYVENSPQAINTATNATSQKQSKSKLKSKLSRRSIENKENQNVQLQYYCSQISMEAYEDQRLLGGTSKSLRDLLDGILTDPGMKEDFRRKKLIEFKNTYPHIFLEKFGSSDGDFLNESMKEEKRKDRNPFATLLKPFRKN